MILTCPSCGTQYAVKDGAIPPPGRQVRCASCKHSWHQDPEPAADEPAEEESVAEAALIEPSSGPEAEERAYQEASLAADGEAPGPAIEEAGAHGKNASLEEEDEAAIPAGYAAVDPVAPPAEGLVEEAPAAAALPPDELEQRRQPDDEVWTGAEEAPREDEAPREEEAPRDDEFSPFAMREPDEPQRRSPLLTILLVAVLIAALAAAFWFLAPAEWKQRVGIAGAGETPLQLMMTHSDRQTLASGNELLAVSGRVINPTDENQDVPPIRAQLRSSTGQLVYSWTIAPPARTLPPGASATFNSAEVNVPAGGDELTITLESSRS